ncbi:MAG: serine/threonine protein kinase [Planctomycetes bacterium]|nr:serine/threonine protein kinase [Planctomycetota bacterium]
MVEPPTDRLRDLFVEAAALPPAGRERFVARVRADDPALGAALAELLHAREQLGSFPGTVPARAFEGAAEPVDVAPRLETGAVLGGFVIEALVGAGGGGSVYRALDRALGRPVALKVSHVRERGERWYERFRREARLAAAVVHPHLVPILGYGEDAERGIAWYAMRFVAGTTLAELRERRARGELPLDGPAVRALVRRFAELADALHALHRQGFVHRDVTPSNAMLEHAGPPSLDGAAVLLDFGLLRPRHRERASTIMGTPGYAAPELVLGRAADARADVFGLGLTMFDLLAGCAPTARPTAAGARLARLSDVESAVDPALARIVARATALDPRRRQASAAELAADLRAWLAGRGRRAPWWRLASVAAAAGLAAVLWSALEQRDGVARGGSAPPAAEARGDASGPGPGVAVAAAPAALRAARCERDGYAAAGAELALLAADLSASADAARRSAAAAACARLFLDRPVESAADVAATAAVRAALLEALGGGASVAAVGDVLAALGGSATPRDIPRLVWWLAEVYRPAADEGAEGARLALHAIARVVHRAAACGAVDELIEAGDPLWGVSLVAALARVRDVAPDPRRRAVDALGDALAARALVCRSAGLSAPDLTPFAAFFPCADSVLAAHGDPSVCGHLATAGVVLESGWTAARCLRAFWSTGYAAACCGPAAESAAFAASHGALGDPRFENAVAERLFRAGAREARVAREGLPPSWRPTAGSSLQDALLAPAPPARPLAARVERPPDRAEDDADVLRADLAVHPARLVGRGVSLRATLADFVADDYVPQQGQVLLATAGRSAVEVGFDSPAVGSAALWLELQCQKGVRDALPFGGAVAVDVLLDGELVAAAQEIGGTGVATLRTTLCTAVRPAHHELVVRLHASATSTLRLYAINVLPR